MAGIEFQKQERQNKHQVGPFRQENIYLPHPAIIREIITENETVSTFVLEFEDALYRQEFTYKPGQFLMVSIPHQGEAPISISSASALTTTFALTVRKAGKLTGAMHGLSMGDVVGIRGPYGRPFPMGDLEGKNLVFVAGGIGMAPLHSALFSCLEHRQKYGAITVLYGSRNPDEICFSEEMKSFEQDENVKCLLTVDEAGDNWQGHVGLVTELLDMISIDPGTSKALVCGPGIMIRFVIARLESLGMQAPDIITTLERHMKCGVGICGHCHFDEKLICSDGPVFTRDELTNLENI